MVGDAFLSAMVVTREFGLIGELFHMVFQSAISCLWKRQIITIKLSGNVAKSGSGSTQERTLLSSLQNEFL